MSNIFQVYAKANRGVVPLTFGTDAPVNPIKTQGLNINADGEIHATVSGVINHHSNGLPFNEHGRLIVGTGEISYFSMGIPFTSAGAVAVGRDVARYDQGVGFTSDSHLATSGSDFTNLYINPGMVGGSPFAAGIGTPPDDHTTANNVGGCNALYESGGNPAYVFNVINLTCRLAFRQTRTTNSDLVIGNRYLFGAEVYIDGYDGDEPQELRGINVNNNDSLVINRDNADHSGTNGNWEYVEVIFDVISATTTIYLAHGLGVINESSCEQRTRNINLFDLGQAG